MKALTKATRVAIVWWIVLLLTLILTASIVSLSTVDIISVIYRKLLVLALVSVVAGTLVGYEDSNDVPPVVVGWVGAALGCSHQFSHGWFWEAGVFGMLGSWVALVIYFFAYENADAIEEKFRKLKRRLKREDKLVEEFRDREEKKAKERKKK